MIMDLIKTIILTVVRREYLISLVRPKLCVYPSLNHASNFVMNLVCIIEIISQDRLILLR